MKKKKNKKKKKKILKTKKVQKRYFVRELEKKKIPIQQKIYKTPDQKIVIKKIKKQPVEKRIFNVKDYVVYSKHGVGQITSIAKNVIGGIEVTGYEIKFEKDNALGTLPINKQSLLRSIASINQVNKSISILKSKPKIKRTMWSRRAQEYEQKINSGKIYDLAEVVRDLNKDTDVIAEQSYSERLLFEKAYERLVSEFTIVLNIDQEKTQKKVDKALNRNQTPNIEQ